MSGLDSQLWPQQIWSNTSLHATGIAFTVQQDAAPEMHSRCLSLSFATGNKSAHLCFCHALTSNLQPGCQARSLQIKHSLTQETIWCTMHGACFWWALHHIALCPPALCLVMGLHTPCLLHFWLLPIALMIACETRYQALVVVVLGRAATSWVREIRVGSALALHAVSLFC